MVYSIIASVEWCRHCRHVLPASEAEKLWLLFPLVICTNLPDNPGSRHDTRQLLRVIVQSLELTCTEASILQIGTVTERGYIRLLCSVGNRIAQGVLCQEFSMDRGPHLSCQSSGLGSHGLGVCIYCSPETSFQALSIQSVGEALRGRINPFSPETIDKKWGE